MVYHIPDPKSGTLAPALSHVSESVQEHLDDNGLAATGRELGIPKSSLHRWGASLSAWDGVALLTLAQRSESVGEAVISLIRSYSYQEPHPTAAVPGAYATARSAAALLREIMEDVEDGRFTRAEAKRIIADVDDLAKLLPKLRRDIKAAAR